ncbi:MAG: 3-deoxy-D-manno-octulosonate 8-phosphate phosphatase [Ginsengibacter sp.]|jgi:3-deoxy-D-manno-octulosonate 8-phosphate phosphatase (KDO 8-P phosphatase)
MFILTQLKSIKTFVFDMDGVLTDGSMLVKDEQNWLRQMNVKDGYALQLAVRSGYNVVVISGSNSIPVAQRLQKLGLTNVFMSIHNKEIFLKDFAVKNQLSLSEMLFMGDDIPDYQCMKMVGIAACPADAAFDIKGIAHYVSPINGGKGCVRDVLEKVLKLNHQWPLETSITST